MDESLNAMLERAIEVAVIAHAGQVDKNGEAYILHPLRVMLSVRERGGTPHQQAAAVLHDVLEDCDVSEDFLEQRFPEEVCDMVDALTHQDGEEYDAFRRRAAKTPGALLIKEADIRDNYGRLHQLQDEETRRRLQQKYDAALALLEGLH
jgi:(p)ppGpp synthase/HD superfamily hydrolase